MQPRSPAKETTWVIPFLGLILVEASEPALIRFRLDGVIESLKQRRGTRDAHVGQQPRHQDGNVPAGSPEIRLAAFNLNPAMCGKKMKGKELRRKKRRPAPHPPGERAISGNLFIPIFLPAIFLPYCRI